MGNFFTWNNQSVKERRISCKLDRIMTKDK